MDKIVTKSKLLIRIQGRPRLCISTFYVELLMALAKSKHITKANIFKAHLHNDKNTTFLH